MKRNSPQEEYVENRENEFLDFGVAAGVSMVVLFGIFIAFTVFHLITK